MELKELEDAVTVMAAVQATQANAIRDHAEWLVSHDKAMAEIREAGRSTDERIAKLTSAIGELIGKMRKEGE